MNKEYTDLKVNDLLRVDPFDQNINIYDNRTGKYSPLIKSKNIYFNEVYTKAKEGFISVTKGLTRNGETTIYEGEELSDWIKKVTNKTKSSKLLIIEGYAGCGKTTFINYLLANSLKSYDYESDYYNYNIGSYYDQSNLDLIKEAIISKYCDQLIELVINKSKIYEKHILDVYLSLLKDTKNLYILDSANEIVRNISGNELFIKIINDEEEREETYIRIFIINDLLKKINLEQIIILDYLLRIAKFIIDNNKQEIIIVGYDNIDSIEEIKHIANFLGTLSSIREKLDEYIDKIFETDRYGIKRPHFVICVASLKTTISKISFNEKYDDYNNNNEYIEYVDISKLYDFDKIVEKRCNYFNAYFDKKNKIIKGQARMALINLNKAKEISKIKFFKENYSKVWNNNHIICAHMLEKIFIDFKEELKLCVSLKRQDIDDIDQMQGVYLGASSIFVNIICKLLHKISMWDETCYNLINLRNLEKTVVFKNTSVSRLILTYILNYQKQLNSPSVSLKRIFEEFNGQLALNEICKILSRMLIKDKTDTWQKPLSSYKNGILNDKDIYSELIKQLEEYQKDSDFSNYTQFSISNSGKVFIEVLSHSYELFINRLYKDGQSLYIIKDYNELESYLENVYEAVENCCQKMNIFLENYQKTKKITSDKELVKLYINFQNNKGHSQLHTERIILSHLSYLDKCRLYFFNLKDYKLDKERINTLFINYISRYLDLYKKYILNINPEGKNLIDILTYKLEQNLNNHSLTHFISINDEDESVV